MSEQTKQEPDHNEAVEKVLAHIRTLDKDAQVDASHDMNQAIIGVGHRELPLWLRDVPREAVIQARQRIRKAISATPEPDSKTSDSKLTN